ncbi:MAG TPA: glycosyltransferase family 39 protein [Xanthobacteraceae bacterium]|nr:glycosyltransferase family 39 protein [Xanthobacteraceae bacterium]
MKPSAARPDQADGDGPPAAVAGLAARACREPGVVLAWLLGLHIVVWTALPILACRNLQLDLAEGLALGREWQLGYWKHPPLPWWIDDLAWRAAGDPRAVYVLGPLAAAIALYAVWRLGRDIVGPHQALMAVVTLEGLHFFNFTAVKFNHDVMQLPLWALTGLFLLHAMRDGRNRDWVLSGAFLALAFWTKYSALALAAPIGLFLLLDPVARRCWRTPGPYLMAATFLVVLAPHLWWLVDSGYQPLRYAEMRAVGATRWYQWVTFPLRWIASQLFFLAPVIALLAIVLAHVPAKWIPVRRQEHAPGEDAHVPATWIPVRRQLDEPAAFARRWITMLALGPLAVVTVGAALTGRLPVAMWGYPLWTFAPLAALAWCAPVLTLPRRRLFWRACLAVLVLMAAAYAADELLEPFWRDRPKATQFPGRLLAQTITRQWHERTATPLAYVAGADFTTSGAGEFAANTVAVYSSDHPHVVVHGELAFSPWIDPAELRRRGAVLIWEAAGDNLPDNLKTIFPGAELQPPLTLGRQTLYRRKPAVVSWALVLPRP